MVYTLTLNPALDYVLKVENLSYTDINRATENSIFFGGKGINVSAVLSRLGTENTALGYAGGFSGKKLEELLEAEGIKTSFVHIKGETRINVKIRSGGELVNSVGCGDSMVAGFVSGYITTGDYAEALRLATACANATAYSEGLAQRADIEKLIQIR